MWLSKRSRSGAAAERLHKYEFSCVAWQIAAHPKKSTMRKTRLHKNSKHGNKCSLLDVLDMHAYQTVCGGFRLLQQNIDGNRSKDCLSVWLGRLRVAAQHWNAAERSKLEPKHKWKRTQNNWIYVFHGVCNFLYYILWYFAKQNKCFHTCLSLQCRGTLDLCVLCTSDWKRSKSWHGPFARAHAAEI